MVVCQAMAETSGLVVIILETLKMANDMALEHMSILMAQPMWVPGKTARDMVKANIQMKKAQSSKETGSKTSSMVSISMTSDRSRMK